MPAEMILNERIDAEYLMWLSLKTTVEDLADKGVTKSRINVTSVKGES